MNRLQGRWGRLLAPGAALAPMAIARSRAVLGPMAMHGSCLNHVFLLRAVIAEHQLDGREELKT